MPYAEIKISNRIRTKVFGPDFFFRINSLATDLDVFENDAASTLVLIFHKHMSVFSLFIWCFLEVRGKVSECDIISVEMATLSNKAD